MSSTPARRRRPSPAVYRRRRLAVLLVVAVVVAGVVLAIWQPWQGIAAPAPAPSASSASAIPASPSVAATPAASPESTDAAVDAAQPSPSPAATASDLEPCSARAVSVAAVTDKDVYGGELPQLSITLTNNGTEACLMNVGTSTQKFIITSGADTWWQSTDCQSESSDLVVQIDPGQTVSSSSALTWDRTRSSVDSCGGDRPSAPSGYFNLAVEIGGLAAHQTAQFVLN